jgi:putative Ca2+/H+ antiporter (TMEM165/GDT1 family)
LYFLVNKTFPASSYGGKMIKEFLEAFLLVFIAEFGDKSQILAMTLAIRYPVKKVLLGILIGAFLNNGLAVLLGSLLSAFIPLNAVQIAAGFIFIAFSLLTLRPEETEGKEHKIPLGSLLTIAFVYFIGEFGDKTQLTAITLTSQAAFPLMILGGTVMGMFASSGMGIIIGRKLGDKVPETIVRLLSSIVFFFFGVSRLARHLPQKYLTVPGIILFALVYTVLAVLLIRPMLRAYKQGYESEWIRRSRELHQYYHRMQQDFDSICLGTENCGRCQGNRCIVGYAKTLALFGLDEKSEGHMANEKINSCFRNKPFSREQAADSLLTTLDYLKRHPSDSNSELIHEIRRSLEIIIFGKCVQEINNWEEYEHRLLRALDDNGIILSNKYHKPYSY